MDHRRFRNCKDGDAALDTDLYIERCYTWHRLGQLWAAVAITSASTLDHSENGSRFAGGQIPECGEYMIDGHQWTFYKDWPTSETVIGWRKACGPPERPCRAVSVCETALEQRGVRRARKTGELQSSRWISI